VDRVFTLTGHGTIVTGTVFSGQVRTGDAVTLMPASATLRVRSIHTQNRASDQGHAGQRCALNVVGVEKSGISRGDWLADSRLLAPTTRVDVRLRLLPGSRSLAAWSPIHVHVGTTHRVAHVVPLESACLRAGESARVQLVFDSPVCVLAGDRFIARDAQAAQTIGGGRILDPFAPSRRRRWAARLRYLDALERMIAGEGVGPLLQDAPFGIRLADLVRLTGRAPDRIALPSSAIVVSADHERFVLLDSRWCALRERAVAALRHFHGAVPDEPGPDSGRLRRSALPEVPHALWCALVDELVHERIVIRNGPWLRLPEHTVTLSDSDRALVQQLQPLIAVGRLDPPWVRELAATVHQPEDRVRQVLRKQVTQGTVYQVVHDLFYDKERIDELAGLIASLASEYGAVNAARYRDAIGLGRKRTIQILEFFDRIGYTRRVHDVHVLRADSGWRHPT
jgi:selenocysteine-specific elongation factor